jgi:hypothetical protein
MNVLLIENNLRLFFRIALMPANQRISFFLCRRLLRPLPSLRAGVLLAMTKA